MGKRNAVRFQRTALPATFNPQVPTQDRLISGSITSLGKTVEEFLLTAPAQTGVLLIHLSTHVAELDVVVQGDSTMDHINSVLQLAADKNFDLCILYQNAPPVCPELQTAVGAFAAPVQVHVHPQHMGGRDANFRTFMTTHSPVVVMGFDACVCVR
ncbi:MAG: hypothetical protein HY293_08935, partial [Planctomycetes bacterium]|nr:hypothetical protein [Planctomycetota bacterium]